MHIYHVRRLALFGFGLLLLLSRSARGQDVYDYELLRGEYFTQATTNRADTAHDARYYLYAYVKPASDGSVLSASLALPNRQTLSLDDVDGIFELKTTNDTAVAFSTAAPKGTYQFHVTGSSLGAQTMRLSLAGPATGIPPIRVINFEAAQAVDASQDFELRWEKTIRRGTHDYQRLYVYDSDGNEVFRESKLDLGQTNITLPAGTLEANTTNTAYLEIIHYFTISSGSREPHWLTAERRVTSFKIITLNPAGVFKFSPICVVSNENDGTATLTVHRTQGSQGEASVDYYSTDNTARSNVNYQPVSGTLTFADGELYKTFTVPLLNDGVTNPPLTVHFTLTNATGGAALIVRPHAVLTILDSQSNPGQNVNAALLAKVEFYSQTNTACPSQAPLSIASRFYAAIHPRFPGAVTNATLQLRNKTVLSLGRDQADYQVFFEAEENFPSPTSMNSTFRSGKYELMFGTLSDGDFTIPFSLGTERSFPVAHLTNWVESQSIDSTQPFTLRWAPFTGATTNDYIQVDIRDASGEYLLRTAEEFEPGALPGTTRSCTIPANTLAPGERYLVDIIFIKMIGTRTDPKNAIRSGMAFVHTTSLHINTAASAIPLGADSGSPGCE